ncbi:MAG: hypothetical protein H8E66_14955 [Planctomycetes bacterium]|nr:hypothetical protein [Planctomycetota bacterium]
MPSERDKASGYEALPDSRPPLWYILFAVAVAVIGFAVCAIVVSAVIGFARSIDNFTSM